MIRLDNVSYRYPNGTPAVNDVSVTIPEKGVTAIIGPNGAGKSTIARLLAGLLAPASGSVEVDGMNTYTADPVDVRSLVSLAWQNADNQLVCGIVEDDVAFGAENLGISRQEIRARVDEIVSILGLEEVRHSSIFNLSSAQKQVAAIAGAMAVRPRYLVLDEVTSRLDGDVARLVLDGVTQWARRHCAAIVMITHTMSEILRSSQVIRLEGVPGRGGQVAETGMPADVLRNAKSEKGVVLQSRLYDTVLRLEALGVEIEATVETVDDLVEFLCPS